MTKAQTTNTEAHVAGHPAPGGGLFGFRHSSLALAGTAIGVLFAWVYWPTFARIAAVWEESPEYSHGYFVPLFALVLLWARRDALECVAPRTTWGGVALLTAAAALRIAGALVSIEWLDAMSLLPCLAGLCMLFGGRPALRWAWPSIAFLLFMIPLPFRVETAMALTLRQIATVASTYALQTLGLPAFAEGNVILINQTRVGVAEACSGLSMLLVFFALATGVAIVVKRPLLDRLLLVASAIPIALVANVTRITVTGVLFETVGGDTARFFFHDLAGWLMMPLALLILWGEVWLLSRLLVPAPERVPIPLTYPGQRTEVRSQRPEGKKRKLVP